MDELDLTPAELRLMLKLGEANDQGNLGRRVGAIRTRSTLMNKLYIAVDNIPADQAASSEEESDAERS